MSIGESTSITDRKYTRGGEGGRGGGGGGGGGGNNKKKLEWRIVDPGRITGRSAFIVGTGGGTLGMDALGRLKRLLQKIPKEKVDSKIALKIHCFMGRKLCKALIKKKEKEKNCISQIKGNTWS